MSNNASGESSPEAGKTATNQPALEIFRAPNGLQLFQHSAAETKYVYHEIFEERVYFRNGIDLMAGETVFDIGANIGLFTVFVKENFPGVTVHAFEPSPIVFRVLQANAAKYGETVCLHQCGVANQRGQATFTFYPHYSIMSGLHAGGDEDKQTLRNGIKSDLKEQNVDPSEITDKSLDRMVRVALREKQEHICQLRTVSDVIDEGLVKAIGLLKIDAEGAELDILAGIRAEHWNRIRQIVMEIHDIKGTAKGKVEVLLKQRGYQCVFEEEKRLSGSGIVNCYARR